MSYRARLTKKVMRRYWQGLEKHGKLTKTFVAELAKSSRCTEAEVRSVINSETRTQRYQLTLTDWDREREAAILERLPVLLGVDPDTEIPRTKVYRMGLALVELLTHPDVAAVEVRDSSGCLERLDLAAIARES